MKTPDSRFDDNDDSIEADVKEIPSGHFDQLIDIVEDDEGKPVFLIKDGNELVLAQEWPMKDGIFIPPERKDLPFLLPRAKEVLRWYKAKNDDNLFTDLIAYLKRFSYVADDTWPLLVCWVLLTYQQDNPGVQYCPTLLFFAVAERGKTRTAKALTYVSYRGIHSIELREPILFRYSHDIHATLFFDLMDLWGETKRTHTNNFILGRFEKGAKVSRVLKLGDGPFRDTRHFDIFGPTILVTNRPVQEILYTRCIPINMPIAQSTQYEDVVPEKGLVLKERLTAWRAKNYKVVLPVVAPVPGVTGRLWDISRPLLQLLTLVQPNEVNGLVSVIKGVANEKLEDKRATIEGRIVRAIKEFPRKNGSLKFEERKLFQAINAGQREDHKLTAQYLGMRLKAMGIRVTHVRGYARVTLTESELETLLQEYGLSQTEPIVSG